MARWAGSSSIPDSMASREYERHYSPRRWDRIQFAKRGFGLRRGASEGVYPQRSSTEQATKPQAKPAFARRVAALLACGVVARRVTERCGYAPLLAPSHKPKSLQQTLFYPTVWGVTAAELVGRFCPASQRILDLGPNHASSLLS